MVTTTVGCIFHVKRGLGSHSEGKIWAHFLLLSWYTSNLRKPTAFITTDLNSGSVLIMTGQCLGHMYKGDAFSIRLKKTYKAIMLS